eukprot:TRINITY_DN687_c0_g1_i3.p1 TRINITY_DN687_c0_g1~~TRINITY_DN687_c0_g1_i3.p1  ORF type:complete len:104 (+),score=3.48 TRINITY_DN687_c0_g1_i3:94-405(+)
MACTELVTKSKCSMKSSLVLLTEPQVPILPLSASIPTAVVILQGKASVKNKKKPMSVPSPWTGFVIFSTSLSIPFVTGFWINVRSSVANSSSLGTLIQETAKG